MRFILRASANEFRIEACNSETASTIAAEDYLIEDTDSLLRLYVATERDTPLFNALQAVRNTVLEDLDEVATPAEVYGLIHWLLSDKGIRAEGASLEETADRLSDIDIAADSDQYTDIIFHLKDAVDRLYEMELDDL
ncbi:hypothetical protein [Amphritea japonica]|uniref:Uncharacterized protein n=1 Tax=Amphritea japonica ATCC BAA-1530 TaxID=1278309 RepID=A0A7R6PF64_9GAMM|nr:hypothetical protein [Amphritea japonica]BBB27131.1 hypothetical protein AMJAP_2543 [Amphritea japonica ATCC BAA-1530]